MVCLCVSYLDIQELLSKHGGTVIDRSTWTIERPSQHLNTDGHAEHVTCELAMGVQVVNAWGSLEDLSTVRLKL